MQTRSHSDSDQTIKVQQSTAIPLDDVSPDLLRKVIDDTIARLENLSEAELVPFDWSKFRLRVEPMGKPFPHLLVKARIEALP